MYKIQKKLNLGQTLERSFEIYKKNFHLAGLAILFLSLILFSLFSIGLQTFYKGDNIMEDLEKFDVKNFSGTTVIMYYVAILVITTLIAPFNAGILKMMQDTDEEKPASFNSLFYYINSKYFLSLISSTFIISVISILGSVFIEIATEFIPVLSKLLPILFSITLSVLTFTVLPNIIFLDLNLVDAFKKSINDCKENFLSILLLLIISIIIGYLGFFAFCIGIFFSFPFYFAVQYAAYKDLK